MEVVVTSNKYYNDYTVPIEIYIFLEFLVDISSAFLKSKDV